MSARHDYLIPERHMAAALLDDMDRLDSRIATSDFEKLRQWMITCCTGGKLPCIRRRGMSCNGKIPIGIPTPWKIEENRIRVATWLAEEKIAQTITPFEIAAKNTLFKSQQADIFAQIKAEFSDLRIGLFGSLASEIVSGEIYIGDDSDLDLLVAVDQCSYSRLKCFYKAIMYFENAFGIRIDCECRHEQIGDFSLKELFLDTAELLIRRIDGVELVARIAICACIADA